MSQLIIADLGFVETTSFEEPVLKGAGSIIPDNFISTDVSTALDVKSITGLSVGGNIVDGFKLNLLTARGVAVSAAAALALNGKAKAKALAKNNH